jgi:mRNA-degrading endonuclease RelE of RelBE toxin-antitoxin system
LSRRIEIKASATKALAGLPKQQQRRVAKAIDALAAEPRPEGVLTVCVIRIGHRRDVYR